MHVQEILRSKPHDERQLRRYIMFIESRQPQKGPLEKHHICPKANDLFPEYASFKNHPWNRIDITPREHYIAHLLLWKAYGGKQAYAFRLMSKRCKSSIIYEAAKRDYRILRKQSPGPMTGKSHSEESRTKMSRSRIGTKFTEGHKKAMTISRNKRVISQESISKMTQSRRKSEGTDEKLSVFDITSMYKTHSLFELASATKISAKVLKKELLRNGIPIRTRKESNDLKKSTHIDRV